MRSLPMPVSEDVLLGFETSDDAAVFRLRDDLAAVLTVDFFTPVVDDPYEFGCIAAANALSDVFAMGATPLVALNILAVSCSLGTEIVSEIIRGGSDKVREAGAFIVGGHSIDDDEPKYGMAVFGTVDPEKIIRNKGALPGDLIFYTKVIGTGIMSAARKIDFETDESMRPVIDFMKELNDKGAQAMIAAHAHAATDVTGFGLVGHLHEMLEASDVSAYIKWDDVPLFDGVFEHSSAFCRPGKTFDIIDWASNFVEQGNLDDEEYNNRMGVLCDPQTSGGLLVCVSPEDAEVFIRKFEELAGRKPALIGKVIAGKPGSISLV